MKPLLYCFHCGKSINQETNQYLEIKPHNIIEAQIVTIHYECYNKLKNGK